MCKHPIGTATMAVFGLDRMKIKSVTIPCNSWNCEECAKRKSIILGNRVKGGFVNERIRFATLTARKGGSFTSKLASLKSSWNRLRGVLVRRYGLSKFFWVLEFGHDRGRPHLHFLFNCYIPQRALSALAERAGFGPVVDIREVKDGGGFGYVFKYLKKDCGSRAGAVALRLAHARRFGCSRNIHPIRSDGQYTLNLEFLKDEISRTYRDASAEAFSRLLCKDLVSKTVTDSQTTVEGSPRFDESETHILIENLTAAPLSRFDLLGAGGGGWSAESIKWYLNGAKLAGAWTPDPPF